MELIDRQIYNIFKIYFLITVLTSTCFNFKFYARSKRETIWLGKYENLGDENIEKWQQRWNERQQQFTYVKTKTFS